MALRQERRPYPCWGPLGLLLSGNRSLDCRYEFARAHRLPEQHMPMRRSSRQTEQVAADDEGPGTKLSRPISEVDAVPIGEQPIRDYDRVLRRLELYSRGGGISTASTSYPAVPKTTVSSSRLVASSSTSRMRVSGKFRQSLRTGADGHWYHGLPTSGAIFDSAAC